MKKYVLFFVLIASFAFVDKAPAALVTADYASDITSAGTAEVEIQFNAPTLSTSWHTVYIFVNGSNTGTIQFTRQIKGGADIIVAGHHPFEAGDKVPITIQNGVYNLRYKASAAGQKFCVTQ
jgi:hypothetical protein